MIDSPELNQPDSLRWRDNFNKWSCFEDSCPHRLAPLSEGRVESDGTLLCAYHAWRFDSQGNCVNIPQSKDKQTASMHCSNSRSCAVSYPTQERQGLLWVWAESGQQAQLESQLRSPRIIPELEDESLQVVHLFWNIRDLAYGWDFFMENVADPAHVPVSHHGIVGDRYKDAKYYDMLCIKQMSTQEGFAFEITPTAPTIEQAIHDFQPPCHMRIVSTSVDGGKLIHTPTMTNIQISLWEKRKNTRISDSVEVTDGTNEEYSLRLKRRLKTRLEGALWGENTPQDRDAVIVCYWWD